MKKRFLRLSALLLAALLLFLIAGCDFSGGETGGEADGVPAADLYDGRDEDAQADEDADEDADKEADEGGGSGENGSGADAKAGETEVRVNEGLVEIGGKSYRGNARYTENEDLGTVTFYCEDLANGDGFAVRMLKSDLDQAALFSDDLKAEKEWGRRVTSYMKKLSDIDSYKWTRAVLYQRGGKIYSMAEGADLGISKASVVMPGSGAERKLLFEFVLSSTGETVSGSCVYGFGGAEDRTPAPVETPNTGSGSGGSGGSRYKTCPTCGGSKTETIPCGYCLGKGTKMCMTCYGNKTVPCDKCGGDGSIYDAARGVEVACRNCLGGDKTCSACSGTGEKPCDTCRGAKTVETRCRTCYGSGEVLK